MAGNASDPMDLREVWLASDDQGKAWPRSSGRRKRENRLWIPVPERKSALDARPNAAR